MSDPELQNESSVSGCSRLSLNITEQSRAGHLLLSLLSLIRGASVAKMKDV